MFTVDRVTLIGCIIQHRARSGFFTVHAVGLLTLLCGCLCPPFAQAHPVSQGSMEISLSSDRIMLAATISREELLVAAALGGQQTPLGLDAARKHAAYLLGHLQLSADGQPVAGRLSAIPEKMAGPLLYRFEYRLAETKPGRIELRQNVLREFEFAPGNNWEASYSVRIRAHGQTVAEGLLFSFREPLVLAGGGLDSRQQMPAYVRHGIAHILSGYDHLLFVGALVLAAAGWWELIKVITVFTLAHGFTLALAALNLFRLPSDIVEPMIALSIVAAAVQNLFWPRHSRGWQRLLLTFGFGLFHGLGFAGGLLDAVPDMPLAGALSVIAAFSAGVEIGHQVVVLPAFYGLTLLRRFDTRQSRYAQHYGSALISLVGLAYLYASLR